ncbi:MAG: fumarylacetoacetate hydrolase family protein [Cohaesibacteraceae bacterium]
MRLASFSADGRASYGVVEDTGIRDLGAVAGSKWPTLRSMLAAGAVAETSVLDAPTLASDDVTFLPVIPDAGKIFCVGINYASHIAETGRDTPEKPMLFVRFADSQVGHGQPMVKPMESDKFDFEGELAVVIGRAGRRISTNDALAHVAGYTCYNDGSIRDWQRHTSQFTAGKNFSGTGGCGPWLVTADDIPDPSTLRLETRLNGQVMQAAPISDLVFDVPALISYCSTFTTLNPGDIIITGTTGGVGLFRDPPVWLKDGDLVEVEIDGIGTLSNPIVAESL